MTNLNDRINEAADRVVSQDVICCVSSMVSEVSNLSSLSASMDNGSLYEQCYNLMESKPDYQEAAEQESWFADDDGNIANHESIDCYENWEECCNDEQIDTDDYRSEVFEHWVVSNWLADKLEAYGQVIDRDFMGLVIWGRTTTGQMISMDYVIQQIAKDIVESQG